MRMTMFPRHRLTFASMLLSTGLDTALAAPAAPRGEHAAAACQPPDPGSEERWLVYVNEMLSHRR